MKKISSRPDVSGYDLSQLEDQFNTDSRSYGPNCEVAVRLAGEDGVAKVDRVSVNGGDL